MTLRKLNAVNNGEHNPDGTLIILHEEMTVCDSCINQKDWGYTEFTNAVPGDSCELCP